MVEGPPLTNVASHRSLFLIKQLSYKFILLVMTRIDRTVLYRKEYKIKKCKWMT